MKIKIWLNALRKFITNTDEYFLDVNGKVYYHDLSSSTLIPVPKDNYTVCRFTELLDKNYNEIFENDLVKVLLPGNKEFIGEIFYQSGQWLIGDYAQYSLADFWTDNTERGDICKKIEIIGNKFE